MIKAKMLFSRASCRYSILNHIKVPKIVHLIINANARTPFISIFSKSDSGVSRARWYT